ncbi:MAG: LLM class flavin-dependent oxidoreductase [Chloroflexi bacterium]|nr:LLM class flavin-dependent oxidoreductase [Chloroflexota bacterium]MCH8064914.1 LLM class flavin-dependent oxidoreductase [Chloroflexota bacterium]
MPQLPALSLAAVPGRRQATIELAQEIERRGFAGIYCPSFGDGLSLCLAIAMNTNEVRFGTSIANIYTRHASDYAQTASWIHEASGGRFVFGIGVSHGPVHGQLGITVGKPLADMRRFVEGLRAAPRAGELPPIVLATLRRRMVGLAGEIADGVVWANGARSHMQTSLSYLPDTQAESNGRFVGNMIPTCISDDKDAAAAVMRRTLTGYIMLPNYQNYWIEAGYEEEMAAIREAISAGDHDRLPALVSDRWLADVTLFGSITEVREGLDAWYAAGVNTPILVPSSTEGGQMRAFQEMFAAFE